MRIYFEIPYLPGLYFIHRAGYGAEPVSVPSTGGRIFNRFDGNAYSEIEPGCFFSGPVQASLSGIAGDIPSCPDIMALITSGSRIDAIRLVRERFGVGLSPAKAAIDQIAALVD